MGEFLSHSECESLLSTAETRFSRSSKSCDPIPASETSANWKPHDFREPAPLSAEAVDLLRTLQAGLCQRLEKRFQALLGTTIRFRPIGLDTVRFDACDTDDLPFSCQFSGHSKALPWRVSWQPELARSLMELLLGGARTPTGRSTGEPLSEIEKRLLLRLCQTCLEVLDQTESLAHLGHPRVTELNPEPKAIPLELAGASYLCVSFEMTCETQRGLVHCWFPSASVSEFRSSVPTTSGTGASVGRELANTNDLGGLARSTKIVIAADLARLKLRAVEILELSIGDVLMTDVTQFDGVLLRLGNRRFFRGAVGTLDGKKAVRLSTSANPSAD